MKRREFLKSVGAGLSLALLPKVPGSDSTASNEEPKPEPTKGITAASVDCYYPNWSTKCWCSKDGRWHFEQGV